MANGDENKNDWGKDDLKRIKEIYQLSQKANQSLKERKNLLDDIAELESAIAGYKRRAKEE
ncbi:MAG: hypothetical protein GTO02_19090, partial [Candidatus Dadabacteria bacterium]|nr:hypothetical protein [Candidatus Dadabacteria bacterium]